MVIDYYPYGKVLREFVNGQQERYLTTQHERDVETGLDYRGARFYDSEVARFLSLDPAAREYPSLSDYCYVAGNPIIFIDPDGRNTIVYDADGNEIHRSEDNHDNAIVTLNKEQLIEFNKLMEKGMENGETLKMSDADISGVYRSFGTNYMVDGIERLWDEAKSERLPVRVGVLAWSKNGKMLRLYSEWNAIMKVKGNKVRVDLSTAISAKDPVQNTKMSSSELNIHTHTNGYMPGLNRHKYDNNGNEKEMSPYSIGGDETVYPSTADIGNKRYKTGLIDNNFKLKETAIYNRKYFDIAISPNHIWLYNDIGGKENKIPVPRSFFKK